MNYLYYSEELRYPCEKYDFSPSECYPEYPFPKNTIAKEKNVVYESVRIMFQQMGLDQGNFGSKEWNPLGTWIKPGQRVVLKPNLVMHRNGSADPNDLESLITHPSIIRCVADYCIIALKGKGCIIVGDSPVKDCDFAKLMNCGNFERIVNFYEKNAESIQIDFVDFRGPEEEGGQYKQAGSGVKVNLAENSWFYHSGHDESKYRIPNYDYRKVIKHHTRETQEYMINSIVLDADVVISLPKPKTHRKNGYTGALKNFVGINYSKEYLPHHTEGAAVAGGDEYKESGMIRKWNSRLRLKIDITRTHMDSLARSQQKRAFFSMINLKVTKLYYVLLWHIYNWTGRLDKAGMGKEKANSQKAREGTWYGNDTLWRTVLDLNYALLYAKADGELDSEKQRLVLHLGDMIISGEGEGPMAPTPKKECMLLFSDNAVDFDCVLTKIMGFTYINFPTLKNSIGFAPLSQHEYKEILLQSNVSDYNGSLADLDFSPIASPFVPAKGWEEFGA